MTLRAMAVGLTLSLALASAADAAVVTLTFDGLDGEQFEQPADFYNGGLGSLGSGPGADYGVTFSTDTYVTCTLAHACDDPEAEGMPRDVLRFLDPRAAFAPTTGPSFINVAHGFVGGVSMLYATRASGMIRVWSGHGGTGDLLQTASLSACGEYPSPCLFSPVQIDFQGVGRSLEFVNVDFELAGFDDIVLDVRAAVPEPAAWALMIAGFGLAGATLRGRKALAA